MPDVPPTDSATPRTRRRQSWRLRRALRIGLLSVALAIVGMALWAEYLGVNVAALVTAETQPGLAPEDRPDTWAKPIPTPELPNLHEISPDLYRGAQPSPEGLAKLKEMGVRTVVNLRGYHTDRGGAQVAGLAYERIRFSTFSPEREQVVRFLKIVTDPNRAPVFVHCRHGADRTGTMCAAYRILVQGWSKADAIDEMSAGGYGYHRAWENLIAFIESLDVESIRQEVGITTQPAGD